MLVRTDSPRRTGDRTCPECHPIDPQASMGHHRVQTLPVVVVVAKQETQQPAMASSRGVVFLLLVVKYNTTRDMPT